MLDVDGAVGFTGCHPVDVDGAAAHALHDAGLFERPAREPRQDDGFLGPNVLEHAEDFHLKFVDAPARENGAAGAVHAGPDVLQRKQRGLSGQGSGQGQRRRDQQTRHIIIVTAAVTEI